MAKIRVGFSSDFNVKGNNVGFGTTNPTALLDVVDTLKGDFNISGVATLTSYGGFVAQNQRITKSSEIVRNTGKTGQYDSSNEKEINFTELGGVHHEDDQDFNTLSEDLIVEEGKILSIHNTEMVGITTIGEQDRHTHASHVSAGSLEQVSVTGHFSVPCGGINERQETPIEGTVRFNDDLNTLEFFNGVEWKQFTYNQGQSGRMVVGGGVVPTYTNVIQYFNINTFGNSQDFGDITLARGNVSSCSSSIRGIWAGGADGTYRDFIEYVTIASTGDALDFGDLSTTNRAYIGATSSSTRGIFGGGYTTSPAAATVNVIDYIEIGTLGDALDFGDLFTGRYSAGAVSNGVRAVWGGGNTPNRSVIDFVNIAAKGNAVFFGDLTAARRNCAGGSFSNNVRGCFSGGQTPAFLHVIDYITIASEGNAVDFGSLSTKRARPASGSTNTRGVMAGGLNPSALNSIEYVNITSTGDAQDFGDLYQETGAGDGCSDSHGGLGGF